MCLLPQPPFPCYNSIQQTGGIGMKKFFLSLALLCSMPFAALGETLITATDLHYLAPSLTDHGAFFNQLI